MSESIEEIAAELSRPIEHGEKCELKMGLPICVCRSAGRCIGCGRFILEGLHCPDCAELPESGHG